MKLYIYVMNIYKFKLEGVYGNFWDLWVYLFLILNVVFGNYFLVKYKVLVNSKFYNK